MIFFSRIVLYLTLAIVGSTISLASMLTGPGESYAQEYENLKVLLQKVQSKKTALQYKQDIEKQIEYLNKNQKSGAENFNALSKEDKKFFIKKFQNNRYHCGEVTQVMNERQRILLNPELANILKDTLINIP